MVVHYGDQTFILDTKWKIDNDSQLSDEDLRQIFAYNIYWCVRKRYLIYPQTSQSQKTVQGAYGHIHAKIT